MLHAHSLVLESPSRFQTAAPPLLSAVICTYERYSSLAGAIDSLRVQSLPANALEIIVIDNSPDRAAALASRARFHHVENLRYVIAERPGLSEARNKGLALARGDKIAFMDDDAVASPGWAAALCDAFTAFGHQAGAVGGPTRPLWLAKRPAWLTDDLLGMLSILDHGPKPRLLAAHETIVGCNMAFDRELLQTIGGFTPKLGRQGPELSLLSNGEPGVLQAVRKAGRAIGYTPHAAVEHCIEPARLTQNWFRRRAAWQAVSDYLLDPWSTAAHAPAAGNYLRLVETSGTRRRPTSFFGDSPDGASLAEDLHLIRALTIATLSGGATMNETAPTPLAKLTATLALTARRKLRGVLRRK